MSRPGTVQRLKDLHAAFMQAEDERFLGVKAVGRDEQVETKRHTDAVAAIKRECSKAVEEAKAQLTIKNGHAEKRRRETTAEVARFRSKLDDAVGWISEESQRGPLAETVKRVLPLVDRSEPSTKARVDGTPNASALTGDAVDQAVERCEALLQAIRKSNEEIQKARQQREEAARRARERELEAQQREREAEEERLRCKRERIRAVLGLGILLALLAIPVAIIVLAGVTGIGLSTFIARDEASPALSRGVAVSESGTAAPSAAPASRQTLWVSPVSAIASSMCFPTNSEVATKCIPSFAVDDRSDTAWCEGAESLGVGEVLTVKLSQPEWISRVALMSGFHSMKNRAFASHGAPSKLTLLVGGATATVVVEPVLNEQFVVELPQPVQASQFDIRIDRVRPGERHRDACISHVQVAVLR